MSCEGCGLRPRAETGPEVEATSGGGGWAASGLTRREFIERATVAAIGGLLVACNVNSPVGPAVPTGGPWDIQVSNYAGLNHVGGVAKVDLGGGAVAGVGRVATDTYVAYGLACTHQGTQVVVAGDGWYCPNHGAEYDTAGDVTRGPAIAPLVSLPSSYDATTGVLTISGAGNILASGTSSGDPEDDD